eukprot:GHVN01052614.1.p1 GENE.GHVN01052614.1~~GHVN01052614.1.p1  ORF type:complete len:640 (-),score=139.16 GHVN01052614.1:753-2639(-)
MGLACASCLCQLTETFFEPYYNDLMGVVKRILGSLGDSEKRYICETAIELAGALTAVVSPEVVGVEAPHLLDVMFTLSEEGAARTANVDSSSFNSTLMQALCQVATCMGDSFAPYLPHLVKSLMKAASTDTQPEIQTYEKHSADEGSRPSRRTDVGFQQSNDGALCQMIVSNSVEEKLLSINTVAVEEKVLGITILSTLADSMGPCFTVYIDPLTDVITNSLTSPFLLVRKAAAEAAGVVIKYETTIMGDVGTGIKTAQLCVPKILHIATAFNINQANDYALPAVEDIFNQLKRLGSEGKLNDVGCPEASTRELLEVSFSKLGEVMVKTLTKDLMSHNRDQGAKSASDDDDDDDGVGSDDGDDPEGELYDGVMQCAGALIRTYGPHTYELFTTHLNVPFSGLLATPDANMAGRVAALCIFSDVVQNCGADAAGRTAAPFLPVALLYAQCDPLPPSTASEDEAVETDVMRVQAACYAIGVIADKAPQCFCEAKKESIDTLSAVLAHPFASHDSRRIAADCAACALLKIYTKLTDQIGGVEAVRPRLSKLLSEWFPLLEDEEEAWTAHDCLMGLVEDRSPLIPLDSAVVKMQLVRIFTNLLESTATDSSLISPTSVKTGRLNQVLASISG